VDELIPPDDNLEYLYQQQYLCDGNGGGFISPCKASGSGSPVPVKFSVVKAPAKYTDPVAYQGNSGLGGGARWKPAVASGGIVADETYDVTLLSGNESWGAYEGDVYRYPPGKDSRGTVPVGE
jgi:hypothetical protein